jgi:AraC-like DNA-binding protein/ligand-binding sensor protein
MFKPERYPVAGRNACFETLSKSQIYRDYQRAFVGGTGLPLDLHAPEMLRLVRYPKKLESPFCALIAKTNVTCAACYGLQQELEREARIQPKTLKCFAGLCESAVPVRVGENVVAFLHTGHVLVSLPTRNKFNRVASTLMRWGAEVDLKLAEEAYFQTRVLAVGQYRSLLRLLMIFAKHLAACGDELVRQANESEPAAVRKARAFIAARYAETISLPQVALAVNLSATHFSKLFRQIAGRTFVSYVAHVRVEKAKHLLQNPNSRITTIAYDVGFQSLSQFNRCFKRIVGYSPKRFRVARGIPG